MMTEPCSDRDPKASTQVQAELGLLLDAIAENRELTANVLPERLVPVLRNGGPKTDGNEQPEPELVPLAGEIRNAMQQVRSNNEHLKDQLNRLEI